MVRGILNRDIYNEDKENRKKPGIHLALFELHTVRRAAREKAR
jgi:hypothetical protein